MKNKLVLSAIVLAVVATFALSSMGQNQRSTRVSYEYRVISDFANADQNSQEQGLRNLNDLGWQGWEVVAVTTEGPNSVPKIWLKRVRR